jgi:hypothetical protein
VQVLVASAEQRMVHDTHGRAAGQVGRHDNCAQGHRRQIIVAVLAELRSAPPPRDQLLDPDVELSILYSFVHPVGPADPYCVDGSVGTAEPFQDVVDGNVSGRTEQDPLALFDELLHDLADRRRLP